MPDEASGAASPERSEDRSVDLRRPTETLEPPDKLAATGEPGAVGAGSPLTPGARVGRFTVLGFEGSGGMGWVYSAYDPELDRKVALKLLRPRRGVGGPAEARRRLVREAQALARLSHPNVITVYDVGEVDGRVFLAMEHVAGETLDAWLAAHGPPHDRRRLRAVLDAFAQAGRGLAAAHAAGLVHRDFKPGNAMVAADGRVVVLDFGIAQREGGVDGDVLSLDELERPFGVPAGVGRSGGAGVGTPAYMAPEQRAGRRASAATDQYSFCAALWEALYGELPAVGGVERVEGDPPGAGLSRRGAEATGVAVRVPVRVRRLLRRGLRLDPADRYPSMEALLDELEGGASRDRRRWLAAGILAALGVGALIGYQPAVARRAELCRPPEDRLAEVWGDPRRTAARRAFAATGLAYAGDALAAVDGALTGYLREWGAMYSDSCAATRLRGEQSEQLLDLRTACLDQRLAEADALARLLVTADAGLVARAPEAAGGLSPLAACADTAALTAPLAPPADEATRTAVAAVRERLAETVTLFRLARFSEAGAIAEAARTEAREIGYWPLIAEASLQRGYVLARQADSGARDALEEALLAAEAGRHDQVAAEAFIRLVRLASEQEADAERALDYAAHAKALLEHLGDRRDLEARLAAYVGEVHHARGEHELALERYRRALELEESGRGREHVSVAATLARIGVVQAELGELTAARASHEEALGIYRRLLGADHPTIGIVHDNLGNALYRLGDYDEALRHYRRAHEIASAAYDERHPAVAASLTHLGNVHLARAEYDLAGARYDQALAAFEASLGPDHPNLALALSNVGTVELYRGDPAAAAVSYRRALAIQEASLGPDHPAVATTVFNLGEALREAGDHEGAATSYRRALAIWEPALGGDHYLVAYGLTGLGQALVELGQPARALAPLRRALELRRAAPGDPTLAAATSFALARALQASGRGGEETYRLAMAAHAAFANAGAAGERDLSEVEAWLGAGGGRAAARPAANVHREPSQEKP